MSRSGESRRRSDVSARPPRIAKVPVSESNGVSSRPTPRPPAASRTTASCLRKPNEASLPFVNARVAAFEVLPQPCLVQAAPANVEGRLKRAVDQAGQVLRKVGAQPVEVDPCDLRRKGERRTGLDQACGGRA